MATYLTTSGKVIAAEVATAQGISMEANVMVDRYYPSVTYTYSVAGMEYTNDRLYDQDFKVNQPEKLEKLVAKYVEGMSVPVYYNPDNPADSYLQPFTPVTSANSARLILVIAAATIIMIVAIAMVVLVSEPSFLQ